MKYRVIELFAGIGGMTKAFIEAGFQVIWANDIRHDACEIFRNNNVAVEIVEDDINEIELKNIPNFDVLTSSFLLHTKSFADNNLMKKVVEIIAEKQPKAILLEGIKCDLRVNKGETFNQFIKVLNELGYQVVYKALKAKEYGGEPHNKERVYIVGFRDKRNFEVFSFPEPQPLKKGIHEIINVFDRKEDCYYYSETKHLYPVLKENIKNQHLIYSVQMVPGTKEIKFRHSDICPTFSNRWRNYFVRDNYGIRNLTIEEYLDFHGLLELKLEGISKKNIYQLVSNVSIVSIIKSIANRIGQVLAQNECRYDMDLMEYEQRSSRYQKKVEKGILDIKHFDNQINKNVVNLKNDMLISDQNSFENLIRIVENEGNSQKKGRALECLIKKFFEQVEGFRVFANEKTQTEEIDIYITNESKGEIWRKESQIFICECKNWDKKIGKNELIIFKSKIENRRKRAKLGFFIAWKGFAKTFTLESLRGSQGDIVIVLIEGWQIKEAIKSNRVEDYLKDWYFKAAML